MMDVSVIIVNYNTSGMVLDCVTSVYSLTKGIVFEVIVVDNGSQKEDVAKLRGDERFLLIESGENIGFGRANNLGAEKARGEYLFLLNPDTLLKNNAISILYGLMQSNKNCGISGGCIFDRDLSYAHSYHRCVPSILIVVDFVRRLKIQLNVPQKKMFVAAITGADLMIRHSIWSDLAGFDERFFMYFEDVDLCLRTSQMGHKVVYVPEAQIIHLEGQSFHETETRYCRILESRNIFFHKYYGRVINSIANCLNIATLSIGIIILSFLNKKERRHKMATRLCLYVELMKVR